YLLPPTSYPLPAPLILLRPGGVRTARQRCPYGERLARARAAPTGVERSIRPSTSRSETVPGGRDRDRRAERGPRVPEVARAGFAKNPRFAARKERRPRRREGKGANPWAVAASRAAGWTSGRIRSS